MEEAGLSNDHPVFHPISDTAADKLRDEMLRLTQYPDNSRPLGIIGQLYLIMDALIQGSSNKKRLQGGKLSRFYAQEALSFIEQNYAVFKLDIQTSFIFPERSVTFTGCHQDNIANRTNYCPESQAGYVSVYFSS